MPNAVVHFEIHAEDPERAIAFYTAVFDWAVTRWGEQEYWLVDTGVPVEDGVPSGGINGAILPGLGNERPAGARMNAFVCTVTTSDLAETSRRVVEHGGSVALDPMVIEGVGTVAYFGDTEGNVFGALQPAA